MQRGDTTKVSNGGSTAPLGENDTGEDYGNPTDPQEPVAKRPRVTVLTSAASPSSLLNAFSNINEPVVNQEAFSSNPDRKHAAPAGGAKGETGEKKNTGTAKEKEDTASDRDDGTPKNGETAIIADRPGDKDNEMVRKAMRGAVAYLDRLTSEAEKYSRETTTDVEVQLTKMKNRVMRMFDDKIAELKNQVQSNFANSLRNLTSLNTEGYTGRQKLFCPERRMSDMLCTTFPGFFIVYGTHILDLPMHILVSIAEYLPPQDLVALRSTCFDFWDAVQAATAHNCTLSTEAHKQALGNYSLVGAETIVTPTFDLRFAVTVRVGGTIVVNYSLEKKKLHAQPKKLKIAITDMDKTPLAHTKDVITTWQLGDMHHNHSRYMIPCHFDSTLEKGFKAPDKFRLDITLNDWFDCGTCLTPRSSSN
ncbi:hypothetical protein Pelo_16820 [Pelomyxa schiedti]|nr:hypothetical protein Pelo_16820 [Pelomyxa schiedti]